MFILWKQLNIFDWKWRIHAYVNVTNKNNLTCKLTSEVCPKTKKTNDYQIEVFIESKITRLMNYKTFATKRSMPHGQENIGLVCVI